MMKKNKMFLILIILSALMMIETREGHRTHTNLATKKDLRKMKAEMSTKKSAKNLTERSSKYVFGERSAKNIADKASKKVFARMIP